MAFTAADLESIKQARIALATGDRVVRVTVGGRTTEYGQASLDELKKLEDEVADSLIAAANRRRSFQAHVRTKGL